MIKLRPIQYIITPVIVADDGEALTPVDVQPITINAADLPGFAESFAEQIAEQEERYNAPE